MGIARTDSAALAHVPALDGVRGIAILTILLYHGLQLSKPDSLNAFDRAVDRLMRGGWAGVDLFFVLSGFLITGILLDMRGAGAHILSFYGRRILRIVPLYFLYLVALLFAVPLLAGHWNDSDVAILRDHQAWYWSFLFNVKFALDPLDDLGRFGNGHLWSLMVEEQFYIVWPVVVLVLPHRVLLPALVACIVGAVTFRFALHQGALSEVVPSAGAYVLAPARMDTLALGALLALAFRHPTGWRIVVGVRLFAFAAAAVTLAALAFAYGEISPFDKWTQIAGFTAIAVVCACIVSAGLTGGMASRLLSAGGLRFFGRYSYAIYLLHYQVMFEFARRWDASLIFGSSLPGRLAFTVAGAAVTTAIALVSWHVVESRFLALKRYLPYRDRSASPPSIRAEAG